MGIVDTFKAKKQAFEQRMNDRRIENFNRNEEKIKELNNRRLRAEAEVQQKKELDFERERLNEARFGAVKEKLQNVKTKFKSQNSGLFASIGGNSKKNLSKRSKENNIGNIFTASSNSPNNIYTQSSGRNPFTLGSGNNPFNFSSSAKVKKKSNKGITIKIVK